MADKVLWGTDWPSPGVVSMRRNVEDFRALGLGEEVEQQNSLGKREPDVRLIFCACGTGFHEHIAEGTKACLTSVPSLSVSLGISAAADGPLFTREQPIHIHPHPRNASNDPTSDQSKSPRIVATCADFSISA